MVENNAYTEIGIVNISDDVVQTISAMAVNEVEGVYLPVGIADGLVEKVEKLVNARKSYAKNIKVDAEEKDVSVDVHVLVDYGVKIQPLAAELQEVVKHNLETMTDLNITAVNIYVDGIHFAKEPKKETDSKSKTKK